MTCELFDEDLRLMGFSDEPKCIYESRCRFAHSQNINVREVSEDCRALGDSKEDKSITPKDIVQDYFLRSLISIRRVN